VADCGVGGFEDMNLDLLKKCVDGCFVGVVGNGGADMESRNVALSKKFQLLGITIKTRSPRFLQPCSLYLAL
jgi:hypothetical protein